MPPVPRAAPRRSSRGARRTTSSAAHRPRRAPPPEPVQVLPPQPSDRKSTRRLLRSDVAIASPDALSLPKPSRRLILRKRLLRSLERHSRTLAQAAFSRQNRVVTLRDVIARLEELSA